VITCSRSRRHLLRRVLGVVFPILCGIGAYVLVMLIAQPNDAPQAALPAQEGRIDSRYEYIVPPGSPPPAACWKYKPALDLIVGEAAEIGLDVWVCSGAELPSDITVEAASGSNNVAISSPSETERSQTSQSWVWRVTVDSPGEYEMSFSVRSSDLENKKIDQVISAHAAKSIWGGILDALTGGSEALKQLAAGVGSVATIVTGVGTIVVLRRTRNLSPGKDDSGSRGRHAAP
jgi:hypothetical protein